MAERDIAVDDPGLLADFIGQAAELVPMLTPSGVERLARDPRPIALSLHALRGTAGFFGLHDLHDAALALERRLDAPRGRRPDLTIAAARLVARIQLLQAELDALPSAPPRPIARLGELIPGLQRVLDDLDAILGRPIRLAVRNPSLEIKADHLAPLRDALVQLLRNAVDHGIEPPAERRAKGKPEIGHLSLDARREAGWVIIELEDDGRGLEAAGARMSPLSGRGLGLDVARRALAPSGGEITLRSSPGQGTQASLRLPDDVVS